MTPLRSYVLINFQRYFHLMNALVFTLFFYFLTNSYILSVDIMFISKKKKVNKIITDCKSHVTDYHKIITDHRNKNITDLLLLKTRSYQQKQKFFFSVGTHLRSTKICQEDPLIFYHAKLQQNLCKRVSQIPSWVLFSLEKLENKGQNWHHEGRKY